MSTSTLENNKEIFKEIEYIDLDSLESIQLEKKCENYIKIKNIHTRIKNIKSLNISKDRLKEKVRKDLCNNIQDIKNESLVRQWASYFLRWIRVDSKTGFQNLSYKEQDQRIDEAKQEVALVLGGKDLYNSKKKIKYNNTNSQWTLRKDLTGFVYRTYLKHSRLV